MVATKITYFILPLHFPSSVCFFCLKWKWRTSVHHPSYISFQRLRETHTESLTFRQTLFPIPSLSLSAYPWIMSFSLPWIFTRCVHLSWVIRLWTYLANLSRFNIKIKQNNKQMNLPIVQVFAFYFFLWRLLCDWVSSYLSFIWSSLNVACIPYFTCFSFQNQSSNRLLIWLSLTFWGCTH